MSSRESRSLLSQDPPTSTSRDKSRSWRKTLSRISKKGLFMRGSHSAPASFVSPPPSSSSSPTLSTDYSYSPSPKVKSTKSSSSSASNRLLYDAVASGNLTLIGTLVSEGITRHQARYRGVKGYTPLHLAVLSDRVCLLEALLDSHQIHRYINEISEDGRSPLHLASERSNAMVKLLLGAGAYPQLADEFSWTPILCASNAGKTDIVRTLIIAGASPTSPAIDSATALHYLVRFVAQPSDIEIEDRCDLIRDLVRSGCPINQQRLNGDTALHSALVYNSPVQIVNFLIELGADPSIPNKSNIIPGDSLPPLQSSSSQTSPSYTIEMLGKHSFDC